MQPSPYTPGDLARPVLGRDAPLGAIEERLSFVADLQQLAGRPRIEVAPRGLGKTSMLREAQRRALARGLATVWVTADSETGLVPALAAEIGRLAESWPAAARRRAAQAMREVTVSIGVPGVAQVSTKLGHPHVVPGARELERALIETVKQLLSRDKRGLVIFIDEIQESDRTGLRVLAYAWQDLQAEQRELPTAILAAGLPSAQTVWRQAATFAERYEYQDLDPLPFAVAAAALVEPARALGVSWHPGAAEAAAAFAEGFPYALQLVGKAAWVAAGYPDPGQAITVDHVQVAVSEAHREMTKMFESRWSTVTDAERRFLAAMAGLSDHVVRRGDLARSLGMRSNDLSVPRAALIAKGIIAPAERRGDIQFTAPGFAVFIRQATDDVPSSGLSEPVWVDLVRNAPQVSAASEWPALQDKLSQAWAHGIDLQGMIVSQSESGTGALQLLDIVDAILAGATARPQPAGSEAHGGAPGSELARE